MVIERRIMKYFFVVSNSPDSDMAVLAAYRPIPLFDEIDEVEVLKLVTRRVNGDYNSVGYLQLKRANWSGDGKLPAINDMESLSWVNS